MMKLAIAIVAFAALLCVCFAETPAVAASALPHLPPRPDQLSAEKPEFWGECDLCKGYIDAGYILGCDFGGEVSKICGPFTDACEAAFKIACALCDAEDCHTSCITDQSCHEMHMCSTGCN